MKMVLNELVERIEREILPCAMTFVENDTTATICDGETMISFYYKERTNNVYCGIIFGIYQKEFTIYSKKDGIFFDSISKDMDNNEIFNIISNTINGMKENKLNKKTIDEIYNMFNIVLDNIKDVISNKEYILLDNKEIYKYIEDISIDNIEIKNKDHMLYYDDGSCYNSIEIFYKDSLLNFNIWRYKNGEYIISVNDDSLNFFGDYIISNKKNIEIVINKIFDIIFENLVKSNRN